jgi:hypothetical protein
MHGTIINSGGWLWAMPLDFGNDFMRFLQLVLPHADDASTSSAQAFHHAM